MPDVMLAWPSALARRFGITQAPRLAFQLLAPIPALRTRTALQSRDR